MSRNDSPLALSAFAERSANSAVNAALVCVNCSRSPFRAASRSAIVDDIAARSISASVSFFLLCCHFFGQCGNLVLQLINRPLMSQLDLVNTRSLGLILSFSSNALPSSVDEFVACVLASSSRVRASFTARLRSARAASTCQPPSRRAQHTPSYKDQDRHATNLRQFFAKPNFGNLFPLVDKRPTKLSPLPPFWRTRNSRIALATSNWQLATVSITCPVIHTQILDTPYIIELRSRQNPPALGLCLPKSSKESITPVF